MSSTIPPDAFVDDRVHFPLEASEADIRACFRLLLGRYPSSIEWPGHSARAGAPLAEVVRTFVNSLEFASRRLLDAPPRTERLASLDGFRLYASPEDMAVGAAILAHGDYEPAVAAAFRKLVQPGMAVLDIGANIGFFTMLAASRVGPQGRVWAVEPNPQNIELLLASREANRFGNVEVLPAAAHDRFDALQLFPDHSNGTVAALGDQQGRRGVTVLGVPLASVLAGAARLDVIKIDVEGAEGRAFLGMLQELDRWRPYVFSEFTPSALPGLSGMSPREYLSLFLGRGYTAMVLDAGGNQDCGGSADAVMAAYARSGLAHIDLLFSPH